MVRVLNHSFFLCSDSSCHHEVVFPRNGIHDSQDSLHDDGFLVFVLDPGLWKGVFALLFGGMSFDFQVGDKQVTFLFVLAKNETAQGLCFVYHLSAPCHASSCPFHQPSNYYTAASHPATGFLSPAREETALLLSNGEQVVCLCSVNLVSKLQPSLDGLSQQPYAPCAA